MEGTSPGRSTLTLSLLLLIGSSLKGCIAVQTSRLNSRDWLQYGCGLRCEYVSGASVLHHKHFVGMFSDSIPGVGDKIDVAGTGRLISCVG